MYAEYQDDNLGYTKYLDSNAGHINHLSVRYIQSIRSESQVVKISGYHCGM
jgi:hypothetical protein